jgi:hypothetical protein
MTAATLLHAIIFILSGLGNRFEVDNVNVSLVKNNTCLI